MSTPTRSSHRASDISSRSKVERIHTHNPDPKHIQRPQEPIPPGLPKRSKILYKPPPGYESRVPAIFKESPTTSGSSSRKYSLSSIPSPPPEHPNVLAPDGTTDIMTTLRVAFDVNASDQPHDIEYHTVNLSNLILRIIGEAQGKLGIWRQLITDVQEFFDSQHLLHVYEIVDDSLDDLIWSLRQPPLLSGDDIHIDWLTRHNGRLTKLTETRVLMKWNARLPSEFTLSQLAEVTKLVAAYAPCIVQYGHSIQGSLQALQARRFKALVDKPIMRRFEAPRIQSARSNT
ncbi:hypothetical protein BDN72DRAFT_845375 [Pluteus cervinus]|uniref:Uncharacterized protein n=1 Tax=Pluteus cervinus TaxID=181527 RepID=A0ACD3AJ40_9AGAR|nr:hypothetical protein BDN72DRAFT_845375 [Pluteus cervinus]